MDVALANLPFHCKCPGWTASGHSPAMSYAALPSASVTSRGGVLRRVSFSSGCKEFSSPESSRNRIFERPYEAVLRYCLGVGSGAGPH